MSYFPYKHIIWDWNGTLFDDAWLCLDIMNGLLQQRDLVPLTAERYQQVFDFPVIDYYRQLGFDFALEPFVTLSTEFMTAYNRRWPECRLRLGAREILQQILDQGLTQSILSASQETYLHQVLEHFELSHLFETVAGLDNHHAFGKLEIGQSFMAKNELDPREILFIGDTQHDYEVARTMGVACWLIHGGHQSYQRLAACGVRVIGSFAEFKALSAASQTLKSQSQLPAPML